jgi:hypothetical protein
MDTKPTWEEVELDGLTPLSHLVYHEFGSIELNRLQPVREESQADFNFARNGLTSMSGLMVATWPRHQVHHLSEPRRNGWPRGSTRR